eukprot:4580171-Amphidinium_carterae.1
MEDRERVLEVVGQRWNALEEVGEVWRSDHGVVLSAVQHDGRALQFAAEALKGDRDIVLAAVQSDGSALEFATEALRADREVVLAAVQENVDALEDAMAELLEDPTFAPEAKDEFYLLKITMLSGRSTVVAAQLYHIVPNVLDKCHRAGLVDDRNRIMELWHGSERVPDDDCVDNWPGIKQRGEMSDYQLLVSQ